MKSSPGKEDRMQQDGLEKRDRLKVQYFSTQDDYLEAVGSQSDEGVNVCKARVHYGCIAVVGIKEPYDLVPDLNGDYKTILRVTGREPI